MADDRRKAMLEAFDKVEAEEEGKEYVAPVSEHEDSRPADEGSEKEDAPEGVGEPGEDEEDPGKVEQRAAERKTAKDDRRVPPSERGSAKPPKEQSEQSATIQEVAAPISWKPAEREFWGKLPKEAQQAILRREQEVQKGIAQSQGARQVANEYIQTLQPFEQTIRALGATPSGAITSVMKTATALIVGTQQQKAEVLAEMFQRYGVDLEYLDKYLTARASNGAIPQHSGNPPQGTMQPLDPRIMQMLQPLLTMQQRLEQAQHRTEEETAQRAQSQIQEMTAQNTPFFEDLRDSMADILELSAKRGVMMTLKQAYDRAVQLDPEISKIIAQRTAAAASKGNGGLARRRRAASSVRGNPSGANLKGGQEAKDRRSALEAAWDDAGT